MSPDIVLELFLHGSQGANPDLGEETLPSRVTIFVNHKEELKMDWLFALLNSHADRGKLIGIITATLTADGPGISLSAPGDVCGY